MQDFLTVKEAAEYVGLSVHTLNAYRIAGNGPPYFKLGGKHVRYDRNQLETWARSDQRQSTSEAA
jgi:excisionase family DNA binding protein